MTLKDPMERLSHSKAVVAVTCLMLCDFGCAPVGRVAERHPDETLFQRAMDAVETNHFTAAHLTLETLINTYPDSEYSDKARLALQDPRIANCGDNFTTSADCEVLEPALPR
jgi:outer membrane protein assembly factor BamD